MAVYESSTSNSSSAIMIWKFLVQIGYSGGPTRRRTLYRCEEFQRPTSSSRHHQTATVSTCLWCITLFALVYKNNERIRKQLVLLSKQQLWEEKRGSRSVTEETSQASERRRKKQQILRRVVQKTVSTIHKYARMLYSETITKTRKTSSLPHAGKQQRKRQTNKSSQDTTTTRTAPLSSTTISTTSSSSAIGSGNNRRLKCGTCRCGIVQFQVKVPLHQQEEVVANRNHHTCSVGSSNDQQQHQRHVYSYNCIPVDATAFLFQNGHDNVESYATVEDANLRTVVCRNCDTPILHAHAVNEPRTVYVNTACYENYSRNDDDEDQMMSPYVSCSATSSRSDDDDDVELVEPPTPGDDVGPQQQQQPHFPVISPSAVSSISRDCCSSIGDGSRSSTISLLDIGGDDQRSTNTNSATTEELEASVYRLRRALSKEEQEEDTAAVAAAKEPIIKVEDNARRIHTATATINDDEGIHQLFAEPQPDSLSSSFVLSQPHHPPKPPSNNVVMLGSSWVLPPAVEDTTTTNNNRPPPTATDGNDEIADDDDDDDLARYQLRKYMMKHAE